jgi:hypothetical protein
MNMIKKYMRMSMKGVLLLSFLLVLFIEPSLCSATEVWSDNFDDGNLDGWVHDAGSTAMGGALRFSYSTEAYRPSNITSGAWSFDVLTIGDWGNAAFSALSIHFMTTDPASPPVAYYCLKITQGGVAAGLKYIYSIVKGDGGSFTTLASGDGLEGTDLKGVLQHIGVTRSPTGHMTVHVNDTLILETTNNDITTSGYFRIIMTYDYAIDNIVVDDALPGVPMELLAIGVGVAAILVVAVVIVKRR